MESISQTTVNRRPTIKVTIPIVRYKWSDFETVRVLFLLLLMFLVLPSEQLRSSHPLHEVVDKINENGGPYIGLVMAYSAEEQVLQSSGLFIPKSDVPWVELSGRRFNIGSIRGVHVIYVMCGQRRLNAGVTVQTLLDVFDIRGIVHYGIAGSANNSLSFGDVSIPKYVAFTGSWTWTELGAKYGQWQELSFGAYNVPVEGENLLAKLEFKTEEFYSVGQPMKEVFWLEVDQMWFNVSSTQLRDLELQQCVNETYCLPEIPKLVHGLNASTADIFVDNAAYREFLFNEFKVSTIDEESAAILMTAMSNGLPCIVFRGVSDLAGGGEKFSEIRLSPLASINSLNVAVEFIGLIGKENSPANKPLTTGIF